MSEAPLPPASAVADVQQLHGRAGHLFPPLRWFAAPQGSLLARARTVRLEVADDGPGLAPLREVLCEDLAGRALVISGGASVAGASWGEILSLAARRQGAEAALIEAGVRDLDALPAVGLPVAGSHEGLAGPGGRLHVTAVGGTVRVGEAEVCDDDLVLLDASGAVALGAGEVGEQILDQARRYAEAEDAVLAGLRAGELLDAAYRHKAAILRPLAGG